MTANCPRCEARWGGEKPEHCTVCHRTFGSTVAGDAHRVGIVGVTEGPDRRRCMTDEEMADKRIAKGVDAGAPWFTYRINKFGSKIWFRNIPSRATNPNWEQIDA